jgi:hypothetical protein
MIVKHQKIEQGVKYLLQIKTSVLFERYTEG